MLGREPPRIAQRINVLYEFFLSDYLSVFHCVMGLRLNLSLAEIWQKCYFLYLLRNWHYAEVEQRLKGFMGASDDKAQIGHAQFYHCSPLL